MENNNWNWYLIPLFAEGVYLDGVSLKEYFNVPEELVKLEDKKKEILFENLHDANKYLDYERYVSVKYKEYGYPEFLVGFGNNADIELIPAGPFFESDYPTPAFYSTLVDVEDIVSYMFDTNYLRKMEYLKKQYDVLKLKKK